MGCQVRIARGRWDDAWISGPVLLDGVYTASLPKSARDDAFAAWASRTMVGQARSPATVGVELRFAGPVNLGDVATGRLKSVIDCLYPVLGGRPGAPDDSRITVLEATRMDPQVDGGVQVRVVELLG